MRSVGFVDVGAEEVHDLGLQAVAVAVVDQSLQDAGGHDSGAADHDGAGFALQRLIDVLMRLVGVDHLAGVAILLAEGLQVG